MKYQPKFNLFTFVYDSNLGKNIKMKNTENFTVFIA